MQTTEPPAKSHASECREFLDAAFGHVAEPGLIEIAHSGTDGGAINRARLFENTPDGRREAADFAAKINREPGVNVYFAPSLRALTADRAKRARKADVLGSPLVWADFDSPGSPQAARAIYTERGFPPHRVVITGTTPDVRAQGFWFLDDLVTDQGALDELLAGLHVGLDFVGDSKVVNADRVMRLPGCTSWPKPGKEGRVAEPTVLKVPAAAPSTLYSLDRLRAVFPPRDPVAARKGESAAPGGLLGLPPQPAAPAVPAPVAPAQSAPAAPVVPERQHDMLGRQIDGRDDYAMRVIGGAIRNLAARLGRWPTANEIAAEAWPTYQMHVGPKNPTSTLDAEGRGWTWFAEKCATHARRAAAGQISGLETIERAREAVAMNAAVAGAPGFPATPSALPAFAFNPRPHAFRAASEIPRRRFLFGRSYIRGLVSATISPGGVGKSSLMLAEAADMALGGGILRPRGFEPLRVLSWNGEDSLDEIARRLEAIRQHHGFAAAEIGARLFTASGLDLPLSLAAASRDGVCIFEHVAAEITRFLREHAIDVVQIDPLVSTHAVPENDNGAIDAVAKRWGRIAHEAGCAVMLVHHSRKPGGGQSGHETTVDDARGAGALLAAVRSARTLNRMSDEEASRFGIEARDAWRFFREDDGKANLAPPEKATWRRMASVTIANGDHALDGDNVGTVEPWSPPDAFDGVTIEHARKVQARVRQAAANGEHCRESDQSPAWAGHVVGEVIGFDTGEKKGKARAKSLLGTWIRTGVLAIETVEIGRKPRPVIVAGSEVTE